MNIQIIPKLRLERNLHVFSYAVPKKLQAEICIGQIVEVEFRKSKVQALVVEISKKKGVYKLKSVEKIIYKQPIVNQTQIDLIFKIAEYYAVSAGIVLKSMLPEIPKRNPIKLVSARHGATPRQARGKKDVVWWNSLQQRNEKYKKILEKNKNKQVLILVPEIIDVSKMIDSLDLKEMDVAPVYSNSLSMTKYFKLWQELLTGQPKVVIGTKMSVLLPYANLGAVIVDSEHDWHLKQSDINPRYDSRQVAQWLASSAQAGLCLSSPAPRVETVYKLKSQKVEKSKGKRVIVDLKDEQTAGNYDAMSDRLVDEMEKVLARGQQVFLLHNRKGMAGFVHCLDCGHVFACPDCQVNLVYYNQTKKMHCHHCSLKVDVPPFCPKCMGTKIKFSSRGIEKVVMEVQKKFVNKTVTTIFKKEKEALFDETAEIIVGTEFALKRINFKKVGLVGVIGFEQLTAGADFRSKERAMQLMVGLIILNNNAELVVQTYDKNNLILKAISRNDLQLFYQEEFKLRQAFGYPPYKKLIKIMSQDKSNAKSFYILDKLAKKLKHNFKDFEILGPVPAYPRKVRSVFKYNLIIKADLQKDLKDLMAAVDADFVIDVDPEKLS